MSYVHARASLASLALVATACAGVPLRREVGPAPGPVIVEGAPRARGAKVAQVVFVPQSPRGSGSEEWPPETVAEVSRRLQDDLAAQPWLSGGGAKPELDAHLSCDYEAELEGPGTSAVVLPVLGVGMVGGGVVGLASQKQGLGTTLLVAGAVTLMFGGYKLSGLFRPPALVDQSMRCTAQLLDASAGKVVEVVHETKAKGAKPVEALLAEAEQGIFARLHDGMVTAIAAAAPRYEAIAIMEMGGGELAGPEQAAMITKLVASSLQKQGVARVIGTDDIKALLGFERVKQLSGCNEDSCFAEVGGALGVDWLVAGSVGRIGTTFVLELRLLNARDASVRHRVTTTAPSLERLLAAIPELAAQLIKG